MKKLLSLLGSCVILCTMYNCSPYKGIVAQDYPKPFEFVLIDSVKGSKDDLYVKANEWMAKAFNSSKSVIQMQDKEAGKIIGKAIISIPLIEAPSVTEYVNYVISIDVKDGRYRCVLSDFIHEGAPGFGSLDRKTVSVIGLGEQRVDMTDKLNYMKNIAVKRSTATLEELKVAMNTKSDW